MTQGQTADASLIFETSYGTWREFHDAQTHSTDENFRRRLCGTCRRWSELAGLGLGTSMPLGRKMENTLASTLPRHRHHPVEPQNPGGRLSRPLDAVCARLWRQPGFRLCAADRRRPKDRVLQDSAKERMARSRTGGGA